MASTTPVLPRVKDTSGFDMKHLEMHEKAIKKHVDNGQIPGYSSVVIWKGKVLRSASYGYADASRNLKYGPDVLVRLYCMTKPFIAAAILLLQDRGKLSVKDPVAKYIKSFRRPGQVPNKNSVFTTRQEKPMHFTILNCLTHTAGMGYGMCFNEECRDAQAKMYKEVTDAMERGDFKNLGHFIDEFAKLPLRTAPGTKYNYSHSFDVLGRVIEKVSGLSLGRFLEKEIFGPLKMRDTGFSFPQSKARRLAAVYCNRDSAMAMGAKSSELPRGKTALCRLDGTKPLESLWLERGLSSKIESGGGFVGHHLGGCISTITDCSRFFAMISNRGVLDGVRILKASTVERFIFQDLFPQVITSGKQQMEGGKPFGHSAFGEFCVPRRPSDEPLDPMDDGEVGETYGGGAACTYWSINPAREFTTLFFTQQMDNDPYKEQTPQSIFPQVRKAVPISVTRDVQIPKKRKSDCKVPASQKKKAQKHSSKQES